MNFSFPKLPKEVGPQVNKLLLDCASRNKDTARHAQQTIADIYSASLSRVLDPVRVAPLIYGEPINYDINNPPEVPINTYFNIGEGAFEVWSNGWDGGVQYNELSGESEFRFRPVNLTTAIAWNIKYAAAARLDVVNQGIKRMFEEVAVKSDYLAFTPIFELLGRARTGGRAHVIPSYAKENNAGHRFVIEDFNRLKILMKRLNQSWSNGTIRGGAAELSDLFISPEVMGDIRRMSYNPMNTYGIPDSLESTALGLPDDVRSDIFRNGGAARIWDVDLHEMVELGLGGVYNQLAYSYYSPAGANPAAPSWVPSTDEIVLGVARNLDAFAWAIEGDSNGNTFRLEVDDQHLNRSRKMGFWGEINQSYMVANSRAVVGMVL